MALSRQDYGMILDAIDTKISIIEKKYSGDIDSLVTELALWQKFRAKITKMWNDDERRMSEYEKERGQ